ncbi:HTH-type transcriptional regulator/antitoxin HigA [Caulobacter rhizosphaerae]|jgi:HTH-type transcriptional regulator/antitoxin HigA|uniref:HTH-type transcriptional regulator/antitoxin HigA n=1 Tax=Caulobacter rhizosphaerae TaxID=2010972 RepID=A0ABU1MWU7_9CAUL|nr:HigA family addiction module antitoxin [Caulobacter rhizosphaerae]MDR6530593.1 HTH-type transcriptional regulator/antitoxin HigA [Caulobacter rhizosphaerae]
MNKGDDIVEIGVEPIFDNFAEPPGVFIREEIEARGWSQRDLAFILGYTEQTITKVISGKSGISAEMAKALGEAFGTSASVWAGLQKEWELREARDPDPSIRARAAMQGKFPIREMISRGWLMEAEQSVLEMQFARFFELEQANDNYVAFLAAARKTEQNHHRPEELAWLYRVRQLARQMETPTYSEEKLRQSLPQLRSLMVDPEDLRLIPGVLAECGVRFLIVEKLVNCKIDGVCTWIGDQPVIGMTLRQNRLDNFWFVLRHEIEHVLAGDGRDGREIIDVDMENPNSIINLDDDLRKMEEAADEAAKNFPFPHEKLTSFYRRKHPYISEKDVIGFSSLNEVHPAIVIGQIQYLKKDFSWLRKWLVTTRHNIMPFSFVDGFGNNVSAPL